MVCQSGDSLEQWGACAHCDWWGGVADYGQRKLRQAKLGQKWLRSVLNYIQITSQQASRCSHIHARFPRIKSIARLQEGKEDLKQ